MPQYERLAEDDRMRRRSIADAIEVLRNCAGFTEGDRAKVHIGLLQLPSGDVVGLVQMLFEAPSQDKIYIVSLPTSAQFHAMRPGAPQRHRFDIARLDGASVDDNGNVLLTDGMMLHAIEVIPARLPLEPSDVDWRIIHHTISRIRAEERCYRYLGEGLESPYRHIVPDLRFLDCNSLADLELPPLKVIASYIADGDWTLKRLSQQKIADTLRNFGVRLPTPRPRVKARHIASTISVG